MKKKKSGGGIGTKSESSRSEPLIRLAQKQICVCSKGFPPHPPCQSFRVQLGHSLIKNHRDDNPDNTQEQMAGNGQMHSGKC